MKRFGNPLSLLTCTALIAVGLLTTGCGESSSFSASCGTCVNGVPVGPAFSQSACTEFGESFECETAVLNNEDLCPPIDSGLPRVSCEVTNCNADVICPQP